MAKFKPQYRRLLFVDRKIREGGFPNCSSLAKEWEVSRKTIQRDIDYLCYELDAPVKYDQRKHGYYYTESSYRLPAINISESDLFALCVAERALKQFEGTPVHAKLVSVFDRIQQSLPSNSSVDPAWIDERVFVFPEAKASVDLETWDTIADALRLNRRLWVEHRSPGKKATVSREVEPYYLVNFKGEWYLSAMCLLRSQVRTFAVSRITSIRVLEDEFVMPRGFSKEIMFGDSFGIIWNKKRSVVRIRFGATVAPYIEERKWHPQQEIKRKKGGAIELRFETIHLKEVKDWVLSWGSAARVLAPAELKTLVKRELSEMIDSYS